MNRTISRGRRTFHELRLIPRKIVTQHAVLA